MLICAMCKGWVSGEIVMYGLIVVNSGLGGCLGGCLSGSTFKVLWLSGCM